jgi:hypothetical protein
MQENTWPSPIGFRFTQGSAALRSRVAQVRHSLCNCYQVRRRRIVIIDLLLPYISAAMILSCGGCVSPVGLSGGGVRTYSLHLYAPFDNARDRGPGYLVGPLDHRFGSESRASGSDIAGSNLAPLPVMGREIDESAP